MNTLRTLTAAVVATFALAAYAGPFGPGAGCPAGATPGSANCPAYGAGYGPGAGFGQRGAGQLERFKAADKNADGLISREEAQASLPGLAANFDAVDTNKDGNVSLAELQAARGTPGRGQGWTMWDANGDGKVSRDEALQAFDRLDANRDGYLAAEEFRAARGAVAGTRALSRWDANGDGKLSREEVANAPRLSQEFDAIDANKDGFLTADELQAARAQMAGRGWHRGF